VNDHTRKTFSENFEGSLPALFQAFWGMLPLNLYSVDDALKADLYRSTSHYASETVPTLTSGQRIKRFKHFYLMKQGVKKPMLKELSVGEHQLLYRFCLRLPFRDTNCLLLTPPLRNAAFSRNRFSMLASRLANLTILAATCSVLTSL
jgi:hypothetical protein